MVIWVLTCSGPALQFQIPNHGHTQGISKEGSQDNCPGADDMQLFPTWTTNVQSHLPLSFTLKTKTGDCLESVLAPFGMIKRHSR